MTRTTKLHKIQMYRQQPRKKEPPIFYDLDVSLFYWINQHFQSPIMESFMVFMTMKHNFYHLGIACAVAILITYRLNGLVFLLTLAATIALNDASSHYILKEGIARPRPCHVLPNLEMILRCSNSFSFPSNHASNTFAAATLISLCFRNTTLLAFAVALLVGYSRVYLKVHYPSDILGGALYGSLIGYLCYRHIYTRILRFIKPCP